MEDDIYNVKERKGVIRETTNFNFKGFYDFADAPNKEVLDGNYKVICQYTFPCSSMLYIDKYLFAGDVRTRENKLSRFVDFVKCYKRNLQIPFQISIISSEEEKNRVISKTVFEDSLNFLQRSLPTLEYSIQIFVSNKFFSLGNHNKHDRLFYTNYSMGNIGNPFASGTTVFNQCFLPTGHNSTDINDRLVQFNKEIRLWMNKITSLKNETLLFKNTDFNNRIFDGMAD